MKIKIILIFIFLIIIVIIFNSSFIFSLFDRFFNKEVFEEALLEKCKDNCFINEQGDVGYDVCMSMCYRKYKE